MQLRSLHVTISYSITEVILHLKAPKSVIEEYLQYKRLHSLTYTNNKYDGFTKFVTTVVLLGTQLEGGET
jgi:hypothetical protein